MPQKIILDVDTGTDDALAIMLAVKSPELELIGCTTVAGNHTVELTTRNTLYVLETAGRPDVPVAKGAAHPLTRRLTIATYFHGPEGLADITVTSPKGSAIAQAAPSFLIEMANRYPGELTLIATGPLTNLAIALLLDPHFGRKLKSLIIMGGAVRTKGNITPTAEANFYNDPEAAQAVMQCGANITLVGLDVTHETRLTWGEIAHLDGQTLDSIPHLSLEVLRFYTMPYGPTVGAHLHDPLAVGVAIWPELVTTERMQVEVEATSKLTRGQSVGYSKITVDQLVNKGEYDDAIAIHQEERANCEVCLEVKSAEFVQHFRERLGLI
jgi:purine nucleosidase